MELEVDIDLKTGSDDEHRGDPIPVRVFGTVSTEEDSPADFQSWATYSTGSLIGPVQLLPQSPKRHRAVIRIDAGLAAGNTAGFIILGNSKEQIQNGGGGKYRVFNTVISEAQNAVWLTGDGTNDILVTVVDERYR